ncbi:MAG: Shedu immune nuclease family protein [Ignavibacteria bacterium]
MATIKRTDSGIEYLFGLLKVKTKTLTRVAFWKIPRKAHQEDICLKIGRYSKNNFAPDTPEVENPKSELTLDNEEFQNLLAFLSENYEPFKKGVKEYIPIDEKFDHQQVKHLKAIFADPDKQKVLDFIAKNNILPEDLIASLQNQTRINAVREFENMLNQNLVEQKWQEWLKNNDWVLGSEFVRILDEREIDTENITDYLMQAYDGFLDIIEIKRPEGSLRYWADSQDHGNYVPSADLTKAITQATKYIYEVEREANSIKFLERVGNVKTIKPRCILIFGRSYNWNNEQREAFRILNSSYHNLSIMTYDHVLSRAKRIIGINDTEETNQNTGIGEIEADDFPF